MFLFQTQFAPVEIEIATIKHLAQHFVVNITCYSPAKSLSFSAQQQVYLVSLVCL